MLASLGYETIVAVAVAVLAVSVAEQMEVLE